MFKPVTASALIALGFLGQRDAHQQGPLLLLKEEKMTIEYSPSMEEATLIVEAESEEGLERVEVRSPSGALMLTMRSQNGQTLSLSGFDLESRESSAAALFAKFDEGIYDFVARTPSGALALGNAAVSHELLAEPRITYPLEGQENVPTTNLTVTWDADSEASGYRVILEQGENDGLIVELPAESNSFRVPDGLLAPGTETHVEVGVMAHNGNCTIVEVAFMTW